MSRYRTGPRYQPQYGSAARKKISPKQVAENIDHQTTDPQNNLLF
ncbi:hypothetical protein [Erwinia tracheiphila]